MSFKIFKLQLTGKLRDTAKIESERNILEQNFKAFLEAEKSQELKDFRELEKWVSSGMPEQRKRELESLVFKGSKEFNQLKEFEALTKSKSITGYFKIAGSGELTRFNKIDGSEKLQNYWELKDYAEGRFLQDKREIEADRFKSSTEEHLLKEYNQLKRNKALKTYFKLKDSSLLKNHIQFQKSTKLLRFLELKNTPEKDKSEREELRQLKKSKGIRDFFKIENSRELKYYRKMEGRHVLTRYEELLQSTGSEQFNQRVAFLKDKKKLLKSEPWRKFMQYKELAASEDIMFHRKFKKSPLYRNYLDMKESFQLERFHELKELTTSAGFLKRKAFLEDTRKWEKSEEYARYQQFLQLGKHPKVELYQKFVNTNSFDFLRNWEVSFYDGFEDNRIDTLKWSFNTLWGERLLGDNYSQPGDLQAYTGGKNVSVHNSKLCIHVRKEKTGGKQWQPDIGFVPVEFGYTSDIISTARSFWQKEGIFEAKIRFRPEVEVVSSCHLRGEKTGPQITLLEMGPECRSGVLSWDGSPKPLFSGINLKNLRKGKFYIFRLEWENNHFIWKINDQVIFESYLTKPDDAVHLNFTSLVVKDIPGSKLPVTFETDWIRCYRKR